MNTSNSENAVKREQMKTKGKKKKRYKSLFFYSQIFMLCCTYIMRWILRDKKQKAQADWVLEGFLAITLKN